MRTTIVSLSLASIVSGVQAQEIVRTDPLSGDYLVTVYNDDLDPVELRVVPSDKVSVTITPRVEVLSPGRLRYSYTVAVDPTSPQGLRELLVGCPGPKTRFSDLRGFSDPADPWPTSHFTYAWDDLPVCAYLGGAIALPAGNSLNATLITDLLPAIGEVRAVGFAEGVQWPTSDPIAENDRARAVVDSLQEVHGWKALLSIIPAREPAMLNDAANGARRIERDLERLCGDLAWISNAGVCHSLRTKLEQAARAVERGQREAARGQLTAFLQELEAQHGPEPGKHVSDDAYWLLRVNVAYLLERL
ncbi:MAG TPA: hypothetical protein VF188_00885 [Longimicrobiales bacterium]